MKIVFWRSAPITADDSRISLSDNAARVWFKEIALEFTRSYVSFFFATNLIWLYAKSNNENPDLRPIEFKWDFSLKLRPVFDKWWYIGSRHGYYDGTHCSYHFGPFVYYTNTNVDCKKCDPYDW